MNKLIVVTTAAIGLSLASISAQARPDPAKMFENIDANADGFITLDESQAFHEQQFTLADANADGLLTLEEAKDLRKKMRFRHADTNGDGFISEEEAMAIEGRFAKQRGQ